MNIAEDPVQVNILDLGYFHIYWGPKGMKSNYVELISYAFHENRASNQSYLI